MTTNPLISVIMPVYNGQDYLKEAIDSILNQSYTNFELIILNDGSKDSSDTIIKSYSDLRIKYYSHQNIGLGATLNLGLNLSKGKYIARQDQDDVSYAERFEKQVDYLEKNPNILLLGTRARIIGDETTGIRFHDHALQSADLKFDLMFDNPFVHSSVMFTKTAIDLVGYYNTDRNLYEDYELWSRFSEKGDVANLPEVLIDYRHHDQGLSKNFANFKDGALHNQGLKNIEHLVGYKNEALFDLEALYHWNIKLYKGSTVSEMKKALNVIAIKIRELYPQNSGIIFERKKQYEKIIKYRLNISERKSNPGFFKMMYLKIQNKLLGLHPNVINK